MHVEHHKGFTMAQKSVIVLDDDKSFLKALGRLLTSHGFVVKAFSTVDDLLTQANLNDGACLLLDIHVNGRSAIELLPLVAQKGFQMPVIFMTAHDSEVIRMEAHKAGCAGYLRKPFSAELLISMLEAAQSRDSNNE
jgi:FixJ family two-component response regulator